MKQYHQFLQHILDNGRAKADRTGTGTLSTFGHQMRFDLTEGFPLVTTKRVHFKSVVSELLWFLSGSTNVHDLQALGCTIWDEWANPASGELGPIYGQQWRSWRSDHTGGAIDQIQQVIDGIRRDPDSRRHVVSAWNVADLPHMALAPCHALFQFYSTPLTTYERQVHYESAGGEDHWNTRLRDMPAFLSARGVPERRLSCQLYQRSADAFLGVPFNIASYALLTMLVADQTNHAPGDFVWTGGDCHIYSNHACQVREQLSREPRPMPRMHLTRKPGSIFDYKPEDFVIEGYDPHPAIKAPVAV